jgi:uncharacterized protein (DUF885 family)
VASGLTLAVLASGCGGGASSALDALIAQDWRARLADDPLFATSVGEQGYDALLPDVSRSARARAVERDRALLAELRALSPEELGNEDQDTLALLLREVDGRVQSFDFGEFEVPLNSDSGFHTALLRWPIELPTATTAERDAYLARLEAAPRYVAEHVANMRAGLVRRMTLPRTIAAGLGAALTAHTEGAVANDPTASVFHAPLRAACAEDPELAGRATVAVRGVVSALAQFRRFLDEEYAPGCRTTLAASQLPNGVEYYAWCVRWFTTLDTTPDAVHQRGVAEVARIRAEMEQIVAEVLFEGDFPAFLAFLRSDPRFYARTPGELLAFASRRAKVIDGMLPRWFGRLPRQPYGVEPVPDDIAPRYTTGRYVQAPLASTRAGTYWVNTYELPSRPLFVLPALTLHEAVPGHHLQIALAQELDHLPHFRRHSYVDAFGEGWALYTEWLGREMGVYEGPYEEFGRLVYEMWRACRLVVDTGLHAFDWDRARAIEYLASNTALSLHECTTEVDRYIAWPGQALAYKLGQRELLDLRDQARARLGAGFRYPDFHDRVLENGSVPLSVLRSVIQDWAGGDADTIEASAEQ